MDDFDDYDDSFFAEVDRLVESRAQKVQFDLSWTYRK